MNMNLLAVVTPPYIYDIYRTPSRLPYYTLPDNYSTIMSEHRRKRKNRFSNGHKRKSIEVGSGLS